MINHCPVCGLWYHHKRQCPDCTERRRLAALAQAEAAKRTERVRKMQDGCRAWRERQRAELELAEWLAQDVH